MAHPLTAYCCSICGTLHFTVEAALACENKPKVFGTLKPIGSQIQFIFKENSFGLQATTFKLGFVLAAYWESDRENKHSPVHVVAADGKYYEIRPDNNFGSLCFTATSRDVYSEGFVKALVAEYQSHGVEISF